MRYLIELLFWIVVFTVFLFAIKPDSIQFDPPTIELKKPN